MLGFGVVVVNLVRRLADAVDRGQAIAVATVVDTARSVPRHAGAKMLVHRDGSIEGTVGGGEMEARVVAEAVSALADGRCRLLSYRLVDPARGDAGVCGGDVQIFVEPHMPEPTIAVLGYGHVGRAVCQLARWLGFRVVAVDDRPGIADSGTADLAAVGHGIADSGTAGHRADGPGFAGHGSGDPEATGHGSGGPGATGHGAGGHGSGDPGATGHGAGGHGSGGPGATGHGAGGHGSGGPGATGHGAGGHGSGGPGATGHGAGGHGSGGPEATGLGAGAHGADGHGAVGNEVADLQAGGLGAVGGRVAGPESDGTQAASGFLVGSVSELLSAHTLDQDVSVVLVTRSTDVDSAALPVLLGTDVGYVGVMGSERRWATTRSRLEAEGVDPAALDRVHAPIGIEVNAETPEEIALSIMAEVVAHRRSVSSISSNA